MRQWAAIPALAVELAGRLEVIVPSDKGLEEMTAAKGGNRIAYPEPPKEAFKDTKDELRSAWAASCFLFFALTLRKQSGEFTKFFDDPEVRWLEASAMFQGLIKDHPVLQSFNGLNGASQPPELIDQVEDVRRRLAYLMAFLVVSTNELEDGVWVDLDELGVKSESQFSPSPLATIAVLATVIFLAVFIGVSSTGLLAELVSGLETDGGLMASWGPVLFESHVWQDLFVASQSVEWTVYSLISYLSPLALMLVARYIIFAMNGKGTFYSLWQIIFAGLVGVVVSVFGIALIVWMGAEGWYRTTDIEGLVQRVAPWGIGPGVLCAALFWKLLTSERSYKEGRLGEFNIHFIEPLRRTSAGDLSIVKVLWRDFKVGLSSAIFVGFLMGVVTAVPVADLQQRELYPGSTTGLRMTLEKFVAHQTLDEDLVHILINRENSDERKKDVDAKIEKFFGGQREISFIFNEQLLKVLAVPEPAACDEECKAEHAKQCKVMQSEPGSCSYASLIVKLRQRLELPLEVYKTGEACMRSILSDSAYIDQVPKYDTIESDCSDYFVSQTKVSKAQILAIAFFVGFLSFIACEIFNIGLRAETIVCRRKKIADLKRLRNAKRATVTHDDSEPAGN